MITAQAAREKIKLLEKEEIQIQIDEVEFAIEKAISNRLFSTSLNYHLLNSTSSYLEQLGYKVEFNTHFNDASTTISWH